MKKPLK